MPSIATPPDFSEDDPARDRSAREDNSPQVPCLRPGWLRVQAHHSLIVAVSDYGLPLEKQSRRAEYDRPAASLSWVRMGAISGPATLSLSRDAATKPARSAERRSSGLSLEPPSKGTAQTKQLTSLCCGFLPDHAQLASCFPVEQDQQRSTAHSYRWSALLEQQLPLRPG
jgi:hypothetical protein